MRFNGALTWFDAAKLPKVCEGQGTYLPVNNDPVMVLTVLFPTTDPAPAGTPAMQLNITSLVGVSSDYLGEIAILPQVYGNPPVVCYLNPTEAAFVWQNGVPPSLVSAMEAAARNAGWAPINPSGAAAYPGPQVTIDSKPHFP